jgi:hypothetical protein
MYVCMYVFIYLFETGAYYVALAGLKTHYIAQADLECCLMPHPPSAS